MWLMSVIMARRSSLRAVGRVEVCVPLAMSSSCLLIQPPPDPLLPGLFHRVTVVAEGDTDEDEVEES
jgi:hypothetical protein